MLGSICINCAVIVIGVFLGIFQSFQSLGSPVDRETAGTYSETMTNETETRTETPQVDRDRDSLRIREAASIAGVHPDTMAAYVDRGLIEGYRLPSGHRRVYLDSLARHIAARYV